MRFSLLTTFCMIYGFYRWGSGDGTKIGDSLKDNDKWEEIMWFSWRHAWTLIKKIMVDISSSIYSVFTSFYVLVASAYLHSFSISKLLHIHPSFFPAFNVVPFISISFMLTYLLHLIIINQTDSGWYKLLSSWIPITCLIVLFIII